MWVWMGWGRGGGSGGWGAGWGRVGCASALTLAVSWTLMSSSTGPDGSLHHAGREVVRVLEKWDIQLITEHATAGYFASRTQSTKGYRFAA